MSLYLLDTDMLTLFQRGNLQIRNHISGQAQSTVAVSVISVEEELSGWYTMLRKARKREELAAVYHRLAQAVGLFAGFQIISFSEPAIVRYEELRIAHRRLGKNDLRISAIALECGATVVTRNLRDFKQIEGLIIEDWSI